MSTEIYEHLFFKRQYQNILDMFLKDTAKTQASTNDVCSLGASAISKKLSILSVVLIHQDCFTKFFENTGTESRESVLNKANIFLEMVLSCYLDIGEGFSQVVGLLNRRCADQVLSSLTLKDSLKEKQLKLTEMHHRVRNNFQIVISLLNLQVENTEDETAKLILKESASRVRAVALIHKILNAAEATQKIEMVDYIKILFNYLYEIYRVDTANIKLNIDVDPISLDIDEAIPCGLIINELVSNIFKHAFPEKKSGAILLSLKKSNENKIFLAVNDNGIGIPMVNNACKADAFGMQLIHNLAKQLNGDISLNRENGTSFTIGFMSASK